jgi:transposase
MIALPAGVRVWLAAGPTDMRRGFDGLSRLVQEVLGQDPFSGHVFAFRGRHGHLIRLLFRDGHGLVLYAKRLERGKFVWPQARNGVISDAGPALDAAGGHLLAHARLDGAAGGRGIAVSAWHDAVGRARILYACRSTSQRFLMTRRCCAMLVEVMAERDVLEAQNDRLRHLLLKL